MKKKSYLGYIVGAIIIVIAIWMIVIYNSLVKKQELVKLDWNEVQNTYQRRMDLIPNLVNTVKGGAEYEQSTLQKVIEARSKAGSVNVEAGPSADTYNKQAAAQDELAGATNRLIISAEKYPDIKGTKAFSELQAQLEGTERRIKVARKDFNGAIADYNSSVKAFPTKIVAGLFGFAPKDGFQSDSGTDKAVEIKF
ncbi:MAG: LemA family protein [Ferruginibacter sp.]